MNDVPLLLPALARWASNLPPLSAEVEREARLSLLDTLACLVAGGAEPVVQKLIAAVRAEGAEGKAQSVVFAAPLPLATAALLNGAAAHALDLDDYEIPGSTHPSAVLFAALLAIAEAQPVTLAAFLRAYAAGYEVICRLGEALGYGHYERGWHATATLGPLGAAMAVAQLQGLDEAASVCALSLAASMAAGMKVQLGADAKPLQAGFAARAGLEAAQLAAAGLTAAPHAFEGPQGFLQLYGADNSPGAALPLSRLGQQLALLTYRPLRKPWPSCAYTHRLTDAALTLAASQDVSASELESVTLALPEPYLRVCHFRTPTSPNQARFSAAYSVAVALLDGKVGPASFQPARIAAADVTALLQRIVLAPYPLPAGLGDMSPEAPDSLTLRFADGRSLTQTVAEVPGGPTRPLSEATLRAKWRDCGGSDVQATALLTMPGEEGFRWSQL